MLLALVSGLAVLVSFRESDAWSGFFLFSLTQAVCAVLGVVVVALSLALRMQRLLVLLVLGVTGIYELVYVVEDEISIPWRLIADGFFFGTGFLLVSASVGLMVVARRRVRGLCLVKIEEAKPFFNRWMVPSSIYIALAAGAGLPIRCRQMQLAISVSST